MADDEDLQQQQRDDERRRAREREQRAEDHDVHREHERDRVRDRPQEQLHDRERGQAHDGGGDRQLERRRHPARVLHRIGDADIHLLVWVQSGDLGLASGAVTRLPSGPRLALAADLNDLIAHRIAAVQVQAAAAERTARRGRQRRRARDPGRARARPRTRWTSCAGSPGCSTTARRSRWRPCRGFAEGLPGGVAVCAYRCVELLAGCDSPRRSRVAATRALEIRCRGACDARREASLRAFVRPCAGTVRRRGRDGWSIKLPLEP